MRVRVGGRETYAYTGSRPIAPGRPAIVFVHGAANDHSVWGLQSRYFAHHDRNVLAVDLPGHGRSEGGGPASVEMLADWLAAFLDAVRVDGCALVGHSMGALCALEAAARFPDRVTRLALLAPAAPMKVSDALLAAAKADHHAAFEMINGWSFSAPRQLGGNPWPGIWMTGNALRLTERTRPGVLYADLSACHAYANGAAAAAAVRCPALLLLGGGDLMTPPRAAQPIAVALQEKRVTTLAGCGHAMMSEQPDATLDALRGFL
jgi:pimeloyl-ACP methyl ester carboxylesterase